MTPEQRIELVKNYTPYLDNNYPIKGKKRDDAERALMVGAYAAILAAGGDEPYLAMLLLGGRFLSKEMK